MIATNISIKSKIANLDFFNIFKSSNKLFKNSSLSFPIALLLQLRKMKSHLNNLAFANGIEEFPNAKNNRVEVFNNKTFEVTEQEIVEEDKRHKTNQSLNVIKKINWVEYQIFNSSLRKEWIWIPNEIIEKTIYIRESKRVKVLMRKYIVIIDGITYTFTPTLLIMNIDENGIFEGTQQRIMQDYLVHHSIRTVAALYDMNKDKINKIIQKMEIIVIPKVLTLDEIIVYINIDGFWIKNNHKSYEIDRSKRNRELNCVCLHTGRDKSGKLQNRFFFWFDENKSRQQNINELLKLINILYPNHVKKIVVGDGARWIRELANEIGAEYRIDKFHFSQNFNQIFSKIVELNKSDPEVSYYFGVFRDLTFKENGSFLTIVKKIIKTFFSDRFDEPTLKKKLSELHYQFRYCMSHFDTYRKSLKNFTISVIEAYQSHYCSEFLRYKGAGFGLRTANNIRIAIMGIVNNLPIYYKKADSLVINFSNQNNNSQNCNNIIYEVPSVATSKETSNNGSWVTSKKYSQY